jgi:hypothetical protein
MSNRLVFRPNLTECILEERVAPAIANLGLIILTTSGYALIIPFPGANSSGAGSLGSSGPSSGSASPVSGVPVPTSLYITGSNGISSLRPGNITGVPSLAGGALAGGLSISIQVGSGADSADSSGGSSSGSSTGGAPSNVVGLATVADPTQRPAITTIGGISSGDSSPVLPPGQTYHDNAPVPAAAPLNVVPQSTTASPGAGTMSGSMYNPSQQLGSPMMGTSGTNRGGIFNPIPGALVPVAPMLPGNN